LAGVAFVRAHGVMRLHAAFWIVLSLLCFGEETSWLQHEIGFATPQSIEARNVQKEFNLHNLDILQGRKMLGEGAAAPTLRAVLNAQTIFQLGFVLFFLVLPVLARTAVAGRLVKWARLPYPGARMMAAVWAPIVPALLLTLLTQGATRVLAAETRELFYAAAFLLFTGALAAALRAQGEEQADRQP
jgi:hypothetical protein